MVPWGADFAHANDWLLKNASTLINQYGQDYGDMNLFFSTPTRYINEMKKAEVDWPVRHHDMFPYSDSDDVFWAGIYSSRANDKLLFRRSTANLHASNKIFARKMLDRSTPPQMMYRIQKAQNRMMDTMGQVVSNNIITGAISHQYTAPKIVEAT